MLLNISKVVLLALAGLSSVQALPQNTPFPSSSSLVTTARPPAPSSTTNSVRPPVPSTATSSARPSASTADQAALFRDLLTAPTAIKRFQRLLSQGTTLLTGDALRALTVFSFNNAVPATGATGGATKSANIESFPILTGLGISTTVGFLNPCGINTPHVHPRATEFLTVVAGSSVRFGYVLENGLVGAGQNPTVAGVLNTFEGTVFPQGSIHFQFNDNCAPATFVASLNSEDPGTSQVAQGFFALGSQVLNATLGFPKQIDGKNIEQFRAAIPANLAQDVDVCLRRCRR